MRRGTGFDLLAWGRRHPFISGSLALHLLLAAGLHAAGPHSLRRQQLAQDQARVAPALEAARRAQMQHHLDRLERLDRELNAEAPELPASAVPLERAKALVARVERAEQRDRAQALARLLKIKPEAALAQVKAEDARRLQPLAADPAQALAQLDRRAREAADKLHERERRQAEGHRVDGAMAHAGGAGGGQGRGIDKGGEGGGGGGQGRGRSAGRGDGEATASIGGVGEPERQYSAAAPPPVLDSMRRPQLHLAEGRSFGPGAPFANRVYLDRWLVAGPFAARNSRALDEVHPPELAVDLDAVYAGKYGVVGWQAQHSASYPFVPEPRDADALYYAATEVRVDRDTDVWLDIGADDDCKLWVNDELVWVSGNADKPWYHRPFYRLEEALSRYALVEGRVRVTLRAGRNTLLLKLYNGVDLMFFSVVVAR
jgi:hypothetical protein